MRASLNMNDKLAKTRHQQGNLRENARRTGHRCCSRAAHSQDFQGPTRKRLPQHSSRRRSSQRRGRHGGGARLPRGAGARGATRSASSCTLADADRDAPACDKGHTTFHLNVCLWIRISPRGIFDATHVVPQLFTPCSSPTFGRRLEMLDGTILQREIPAPIRQLPSARSRHDDAAHPSNDNKALPNALVRSLDAVLGPRRTSSFCACQSQLQQRLQGVFAAPPLAILPLGDARSMVRGHAR
mmetsp:Transcript_5298/g.17201  ORF Transcript_5298/g.17201 Transcript_5298/m.17201 type:complete len:242 (+) Transcript_5298:83-808(+)